MANLRMIIAAGTAGRSKSAFRGTAPGLAATWHAVAMTNWQARHRARSAAGTHYGLKEAWPMLSHRLNLPSQARSLSVGGSMARS